MTLDELEKRARNKTLTVRQAVEFTMNHPTVTENRRKRVGRIEKNFQKMQLDFDMPLHQVATEENAYRFSKKAKEYGGTNKFGNYQAMEDFVFPMLQRRGVLGLQTKEGRPLFPKLTGVGGEAEALGFGGKQSSDLGGERPMRGLIPQKNLDAIYEEAFSTGKLSQLEMDALDFHKGTFARMTFLFGEDGLNKNQVTFVTPEGNVKADKYTSGDILEVRVDGEVRGSGTKDTKRRPPYTFKPDGKLGSIIIRNVEASPTGKVFPISQKRFDDVFRMHISPTLIARHSDVLPLVDKLDPKKGVISTGSVVRSAMPLILRQELQMPTDMVEAMMGHTDGSILTKNYTGDVPTLVSQGLEDLASGRVDVPSPITAAPMGQQAATAVPLTSEAQQAVSEQVTAEAQQKATSARLAQIEDEKRIVQYYKSSEGQELLEAQQQLELDEIRRAEELKKEKSKLRGEAKAKEEADKRSQAVKELGDNETARARRKALRQALAKGTKAVGAFVAPIAPPVGLGLFAAGSVLSTAEAAPFAKQAGETAARASLTEDPEERTRLRGESARLAGKSLATAFSPIPLEERTPEQEKFLRESREIRAQRMQSRRERATSAQMDELMSKQE